MPKTPAISTICISAKCSDLFHATSHDGDGKTNGEYDGYVPDFFPGDHFGDYVQLKIDVKTGRILNWKAPTQKVLKKAFDITG